MTEAGYDKIEALDWRYSAAIVGLVGYLKFYQCDFEESLDVLLYHNEDVTEERYLQYVEYFFPDDMHHVVAENMIKQEKNDEESLKIINAKLTGNTVLTKYFKNKKYDGTNAEEILEIIESQRLEFIKETYRNKANLYANFANRNQLFEKEKNCCRLVGYCIDVPKKGKSISYNFNPVTYISQDSEIFDFIPFAFTIGRESLFINDNSTIKNLKQTNRNLRKKVEKAIETQEMKGRDIRRAFFQAIIESQDFVEDDVEVIIKKAENSFFETMYVRKEAIRIFKAIPNYKSFCFSYKVNENYYINIQEKVINAIINKSNVEDLIGRFLQVDNQQENLTQKKYVYLVDQLININLLIKTGGKKMYLDIKSAKESARKVTMNEKVQNNKLKAYRTKLTSALIFQDYTRYCDILMQLANYTESEFEFAYKLFDNFDKNKEIAYAFVNALGSYQKEEQEEK